MLCKTDHLCAFPSGIALEKELPLNAVGADSCLSRGCSGDRPGCRAGKIACAGKSHCKVLKRFQAWAVHQVSSSTEASGGLGDLATVALCSRGAATS